MTQQDLFMEWLKRSMMKQRYLLPFDLHRECSVDLKEAEEIFKRAVEEGVLYHVYQLFCPECEDLLEEVKSLDVQHRDEDEDEEDDEAGKLYCFKGHETTLEEIKQMPWLIKTYYRIAAKK